MKRVISVLLIAAGFSSCVKKGKTMSNLLKAVILVVPMIASGQTVFRVDPNPVTTTAGNAPVGGNPALYAVAGSSIQLCSNASCTASATTYTDSTGTTACPGYAQVTLPGSVLCTSTTGPQGQFGFWIGAGTYWYKVTTTTGQTYGPYPMTTTNTAGVTNITAGTGISITPNVGSPVVTNTGATSFNGRTGSVTPQGGDYSASQVTNAVDQTQIYSNPNFINSLAWSKITGAPTFVVSFNSRMGTVIPTTGDYNAGQVTNAVDLTASYSNPSWITALAWSKLTGLPNFVNTFNGRQGAVTSASGDYTFSQIGGTKQGTSSVPQMATGSFVAGDYLKYDANGNAIDGGVPSGGSGAFNTITTGQNTSATMTVGSGASFLSAGTATINFGTAGATTPAMVGLAANKPATCGVGQMYFASDATAGQNWYYCTATNSWTQQIIGGSGSPAFSAVTNGTNGYHLTMGTGGLLDSSGSAQINFGTAGHTTPTLVGVAASKPATCSVGEMYFASDGTAGQNFYYCTATNTWTLQLVGGSGSPTFSAVTNGTNANHLTVGSSGIFDTSGSAVINFATGQHTTPTLVGTYSSIPATCTVGEQYFANNGTAGLNLYFCTATNTWTVMSGSGGGGGITSINTLTNPAITLAVYNANNGSWTNSGGNTITFRLPQDLGTSNSPSFAALTTTGNITGATGLYTGASPVQVVDGSQNGTFHNVTISGTCTGCGGGGGGITSINSQSGPSMTLGVASTGNLILSTNTGNVIKYDTVQNITTSSAPSFAGMTLTAVLSGSASSGPAASFSNNSSGTPALIVNNIASGGLSAQFDQGISVNDGTYSQVILGPLEWTPAYASAVSLGDSTYPFLNIYGTTIYGSVVNVVNPSASVGPSLYVSGNTSTELIEVTNSNIAGYGILDNTSSGSKFVSITTPYIYPGSGHTVVTTQGHIGAYQASAPTILAGTGCSLSTGSTDTKGLVICTSGFGNPITVGFNTTFNIPPKCVVSLYESAPNVTSAIPMLEAISTAGFSVYPASTPVGGNPGNSGFYYICIE